MCGRSLLTPPLARAIHLALALGVTGSVMGCGPGFSVRAHAPTDIGTGGPGAAARASASAAAGPSLASRAAPSAPQLEGFHDDELPALPAPESGPDEGASDAFEPAALNDDAHDARARAPATRYASLDRAACEAELDKRRIPFERVGEARGVIAPLRLKGPISGVDYHSMLPLAQRKTSPYEIYDCRLVLALDDWARVLARHDVVEVIHYSVYRPPPTKQVLTGAGRRHSGALAIDAAIFKMRDGQTISVEKDFHGRIGSKPCAASTAGLPAPAVTLRKLVCEAADAQIFNVMLTPDFNRPHHNHFHLEVTAGARWTFVR